MQTAASAIPKNESVAHAVLERLVEAGLIEGRGATCGRMYTLSAQVYQRLGHGQGAYNICANPFITST